MVRLLFLAGRGGDGAQSRSLWMIMLIYKAMYKFVDGGVHAEVLDFPGVITCAENLPEAKRLLASALVDMAETCLLLGESLPQTDSSCTHPDADIEEPIYLLLTAASRVSVIPEDAVAA